MLSFTLCSVLSPGADTCSTTPCQLTTTVYKVYQKTTFARVDVTSSFVSANRGRGMPYTGGKG
jgi:hypothetical protein